MQTCCLPQGSMRRGCIVALLPRNCPGGGEGLKACRQVSLLQQPPGVKFGQTLQVTLGAVQLLAGMTSRHWPPWQVCPAGQQTLAPAAFSHSWDSLQQVPSGCATVPSGQQMRLMVPSAAVMLAAPLGQHTPGMDWPVVAMRVEQGSLQQPRTVLVGSRAGLCR
jgi:hypothetical protein